VREGLRTSFSGPPRAEKRPAFPFPKRQGRWGTGRARYRAPRSSVTQELLRGVAGGLRAALAALVEQLFAEGDEAAALQWRESSSWDGPHSKEPLVLRQRHSRGSAQHPVRRVWSSLVPSPSYAAGSLSRRGTRPSLGVQLRGMPSTRAGRPGPPVPPSLPQSLADVVNDRSQSSCAATSPGAGVCTLAERGCHGSGEPYGGKSPKAWVGPPGVPGVELPHWPS
jgi:hypothetical protein